MDGHECHVHRGHAFVVTGSVRLPYEPGDEDAYIADLKFHQQLEALTERLEHELRALNLYLCAQLGLFDHYWYVQQGTKQIPIQSTATDVPVQRLRGYVARREIPALNAFLRRMRRPIGQDYIKLAWDHWDHSLIAGPDHMEMLSLVMALEALFNVGQTDLRYRIARNMAALLGNSPDEAEYIFQSIKEAYDLRSKLVHTGKADLRKASISSLRLYVQRAILKLLAP